MAKKKTKNVKNNTEVIKKAGIRFNENIYIEIDADLNNVPGSKIITEVNGETTEYDLGGGGGTTIEPLEITANGTYEAPTGTAYNPVTVNVGDEYEEVVIWTNPDPSKGLKIDTEIIQDYDIDQQHIEYIKIRYRNMNTEPNLVNEITLTIDQLWENFAGALVSTGDFDQDLMRHQYYVRPVIHNGDWGGLWFLGQCREVSAAATDKNFRAVPEVVYGYKRREV